jgi:hypothetical protein
MAGSPALPGDHADDPEAAGARPLMRIEKRAWLNRCAHPSPVTLTQMSLEI